MTESEKDAEIVRLRERYVELLQLLGKAMHNGYLDENACSPWWLKEARRAVTPTDDYRFTDAAGCSAPARATGRIAAPSGRDMDLGMFRGS